MTTIIKNVADNEYGYDKRAHVKGASEIILRNCSHWINEEGNREEITDAVRKEIEDSIQSYAKKALRTICIAYKDLREGEGGHDHDQESDDPTCMIIEKEGLTCITILGIKDIIRPEVPDAVSQCEQA
jgi:magnesium-transporting ATPase (P-type)